MPFPISSTLLDAIVLAIVAKEDTYGYRITQDIQKVIEISDSTLYPVLRRLMKNGFLTTHDEPSDGRIRRYYRITPTGRIHLAEALKDWAKYRDSIESVFFGGNPHG